MLVALLIAAADASVLRSSNLLRQREQPSDVPPACLRMRGGAKDEHTYAMLKPDVASNQSKVDAITEIIEDAGLRVVRKEKCKLREHDCKIFYEEHKERPFFPDLIKFMISGPVLKMELAGPDAIKQWRSILGPTNSLKAIDEAPDSIRAKFGTDGQKNAAHGSDSPESAERELDLMFQGGGWPLPPMKKESK